MRKNRIALAVAMAYPFVLFAQQADPGPSKDAGVVTIVSQQPSSLPTHIPAAMEGTTAELKVDF